MRAILLSAGQGRRLLPLTEEAPKCLLPVDGEQTILELQLAALARCGVARATVLVGFGAERVERFLAEHPVPGLAVQSLFNPFYATSDNLATCWLARAAMTEDFALLNGDTLFEDGIAHRLLSSSKPITVGVDRKADYDDDDMKVSLDDEGRLRAIGKRLPSETVNGESIGFLAFRGPGVVEFRSALDRAIRRPEALRAWYLSVVDELAQQTSVATASVEGLWWREIDSCEDLAEVRGCYAAREKEPGARAQGLR